MDSRGNSLKALINPKLGFQPSPRPGAEQFKATSTRRYLYLTLEMVVDPLTLHCILACRQRLRTCNDIAARHFEDLPAIDQDGRLSGRRGKRHRLGLKRQRTKRRQIDAKRSRF